MRNIMKNKRASFQSIVVTIIIIFILAIGFIIFSKIFLDVTAELKTIPEFSNNTIDSIETVEGKTIPLLDFSIFFSLAALMIGLIIASIYIDVHPAIVIIFIIALIVAIFLSGMMSNVYSEITSSPQLSSTAGEFSYTNLVLGSHFPIIVLVIGIIIIIILYGKSRRVGEV